MSISAQTAQRKVKEDDTMEMKDIMEMAIKAGAVEQVSKLAGIDAKEAAPAIEAVLPLLIKGMQSQAKSKDTKESFLKALDDHSKDDTTDVVICFFHM